LCCIIPIVNEITVRHTNTHAIGSILDLCFMKDKDQVGHTMSGVPTVDIGLVDFSLPEKKLVGDDLPHFIRMELWDAPSGITIVSKNIEVIYLDERACVTGSICRIMKNIVIPSLGNVNHSPKLLGILVNASDGNKVSNTDEERNITAEDAQWG
jgi:hypothetical protein